MSNGLLWHPPSGPPRLGHPMAPLMGYGGRGRGSSSSAAAAPTVKDLLLSTLVPRLHRGELPRPVPLQEPMQYNRKLGYWDDKTNSYVSYTDQDFKDQDMAFKSAGKMAGQRRGRFEAKNDTDEDRARYEAEEASGGASSSQASASAPRGAGYTGFADPRSEEEKQAAREAYLRQRDEENDRSRVDKIQVDALRARLRPLEDMNSELEDEIDRTKAQLSLTHSHESAKLLIAKINELTDRQNALAPEIDRLVARIGALYRRKFRDPDFATGGEFKGISRYLSTSRELALARAQQAYDDEYRDFYDQWLAWKKKHDETDWSMVKFWANKNDQDALAQIEQNNTEIVRLDAWYVALKQKQKFLEDNADFAASGRFECTDCPFKAGNEGDAEFESAGQWKQLKPRKKLVHPGIKRFLFHPKPNRVQKEIASVLDTAGQFKVKVVQGGPKQVPVQALGQRGGQFKAAGGSPSQASLAGTTRWNQNTAEQKKYITARLILANTHAQRAGSEKYVTALDNFKQDFPQDRVVLEDGATGVMKDMGPGAGSPAAAGDERNPGLSRGNPWWKSK